MGFEGALQPAALTLLARKTLGPVAAGFSAAALHQAMCVSSGSAIPCEFDETNLSTRDGGSDPGPFPARLQKCLFLEPFSANVAKRE